MKPFKDSTKFRPGRPHHAFPTQVAEAEHCAALLLDTVPQIMRAMRMAIGDMNFPLTVPQFRTLHFVQSHTGASLSATADFLGLTLPSTSKLVDHLVKDGLLTRDNDASDRRRMTLRLTDKGDALLKGAQASVRRRLAGTLNRFRTMDLVALQKALGLLRESFPAPPLGHLPPLGANGADQGTHLPLGGNQGNGTVALSDGIAISQIR